MHSNLHLLSDWILYVNYYFILGPKLQHILIQKIKIKNL